MKLRNLCDQSLWSSAMKSASNERAALTNLLHHLVEIERRRLFSKYKFTSMFDYVVRGLKYSEAEAGLRISAMRLLRDISEIEGKVADGSLSITNLRLAQKMFATELKNGRNMDKSAKMEVLDQLLNLSTRQAEKVVHAICPSMDLRKELHFNDIQDEALREKLLRLKGKFAHIKGDMSLIEVLHKLCDDALMEKLPRAQDVVFDTESTAAVRRAVWARDEGMCSNCGSTYAVEIDHILPQAAGGASTLENMRLLCRSCNQRAAIEYFGREKMEGHLRESVTPYSADFLDRRRRFG